MRNKKVLLSILFIGIFLVIFGVSYAFFEYSKVGANHELIAGDIYMNFNEGTDSLSLGSVYPESVEHARSRDDNYITFTIDGKNESDNDIYYEIDLIHGDDHDGLTRFNDKDLKFDLSEIVNGEETLLKSAVSFNEINNTRLWVDTINSEIENYSKTYKLRMWLDENVLISDTNPDATYSASTYKNHYASIKVKVVGDFDDSRMPKPKCMRATSLHTETCSQTSDYCGADGYASGSAITYGNLGSAGTLVTGDAFDCDVNGDGEYNSETERFYYVTDMNSDTAVLIYYNNVSGGLPDNMSAYAYNTNYSNTNYFGPQTAILQLPTTSQWKNVSLTNTIRDIKDEKGTTRVSGFSYEGYAARLLTTQEVSAGCGFTVGSAITGELSTKCKFLMENTKYSSSSLKTYGPWLENPSSSYAGYAWIVYGNYRYVDNYFVDIDSLRGVRPAIEVSKSDIEI